MPALGVFHTASAGFLSFCLLLPSGFHLWLCDLPLFVSYLKVPSPDILPTGDFNFPRNHKSVCGDFLCTPFLEEELDVVLFSLHNAFTLPPGFSTNPLGSF